MCTVSVNVCVVVRAMLEWRAGRSSSTRMAVGGPTGAGRSLGRTTPRWTAQPPTLPAGWQSLWWRPNCAGGSWCRSDHFQMSFYLLYFIILFYGGLGNMSILYGYRDMRLDMVSESGYRFIMMWQKLYVLFFLVLLTHYVKIMWFFLTTPDWTGSNLRITETLSHHQTFTVSLSVFSGGVRDRSRPPAVHLPVHLRLLSEEREGAAADHQQKLWSETRRHRQVSVWSSWCRTGFVVLCRMIVVGHV